MTREERVDRLVAYLKKENEGYAAIREPVNYDEKRSLLRSLMNVRFPGEAAGQYVQMQDKLLKEEASEKGIVACGDLPAAGEVYPCREIRNADRIFLWQGDITRLAADAIVNAANSQMLGCFVPCHGCIDNAIHSAAGIQLRNECARLMEEQGHEEAAGKAKITDGYNLPAGHVIHTVGPIWNGGKSGEAKLLENAYQNSLQAAVDQGIRTIAFPSISTGVYSYPVEQAALIAVKTVRKFCEEHRDKIDIVRFVLFDAKTCAVYDHAIRESETVKE